MLSERDILAQREHYTDLLREAERERIVRQALAPNKPLRFQECVLRWLDRYFGAWGCYLRRHDALGVFDGNQVSFRGVMGIAADSVHPC